MCLLTKVRDVHKKVACISSCNTYLMINLERAKVENATHEVTYTDGGRYKHGLHRSIKGPFSIIYELLFGFYYLTYM